MTDDALAHATEILPLYRQAHVAYIVFCERASKVMLAPESELDFREFELAAARVEGTMIRLQEVVRRTWEASRKLDKGLLHEGERAA